MSKQELINLLQEELDNDSDFSARRERQLNTAKKGNRVFAQNVGGPVFEYLDTVYTERVKEIVKETIKESIEELFEERLSKIEEDIKALKKKVK